MKELYRDRDVTKVYYYRALLEAEKIPVIIRNEYLATSGITEIPIAEFFPNICVMHDSDYERAREILKHRIETDGIGSDLSVKCPACEESNPGNFELCYSCGAEIAL